MVGLKPDVNPGVLVLNENTVIYVCGHTVVIQDVKDSKERTQRYIPGKFLHETKRNV